jgi:hypothetical protein
VCGAPAVAWLPAAARPERRGEVWRWGTGGEGRRHRARWLSRELIRGAARRGGGGGAAARRRSARPTMVGTAASRCRAAGTAHRRGQGELSAGIGWRNSDDGSGRQGVAALVSAWRSGRKRLDVAELGYGVR